MKKAYGSKAVPVSLFLIGLVMLIEAAATLFVLLQAPAMMSSSASWLYVLVKGAVSLYVLFIGWWMIRK
ncbi:MAG: hypothetical protein HY517_02305 [Candidatus Aenigmarchaeota archaeon]|nr:hypothetical protein [Candidatus Aenigmarchaeota archaeon]